mgnify:CR=1 FL=1|jgi:invasion protein IalB
MSKRCKVKGCKAELTNTNNLFCSIHEGDKYVFSERNVGRESKK